MVRQQSKRRKLDRIDYDKLFPALPSDWDLVRRLVPPTVLDLAPLIGEYDQHTMEFSVDLSPDELQLLDDSPLYDIAIQVSQLTSSPGSSLELELAPFTSQATLHSGGANSAAAVHLQINSDHPNLIKQLINVRNGKVKLTCSSGWGQYSTHVYVGTLTFVRFFPPAGTLKYKILKYVRGRIPKEVTKERIQALITQDFDLTGDNFMDINVICPLTTKRMLRPVRYSTCSHPQCFELTAFLEMVRTSLQNRNKIFSFERCPICREAVKYNDLWTDDFFTSILQGQDRTNHKNPNASFVRIYANGDWEWESGYMTSRGIRCKEVVQMVLAVDDDIVTIEDSDDDNDDVKPSARLNSNGVSFEMAIGAEQPQRSADKIVRQNQRKLKELTTRIIAPPKRTPILIPAVALPPAPAASSTNNPSLKIKNSKGGSRCNEVQMEDDESAPVVIDDDVINIEDEDGDNDDRQRQPSTSNVVSRRLTTPTCMTGRERRLYWKAVDKISRQNKRNAAAATPHTTNRTGKKKKKRRPKPNQRITRAMTKASLPAIPKTTANTKRIPLERYYKARKSILAKAQLAATKTSSTSAKETAGTGRCPALNDASARVAMAATSSSSWVDVDDTNRGPLSSSWMSRTFPYSADQTMPNSVFVPPPPRLSAYKRKKARAAAKADAARNQPIKESKANRRRKRKLRKEALADIRGSYEAYPVNPKSYASSRSQQFHRTERMCNQFPEHARSSGAASTDVSPNTIWPYGVNVNDNAVHMHQQYSNQEWIDQRGADTNIRNGSWSQQYSNPTWGAHGRNVQQPSFNRNPNMQGPQQPYPYSPYEPPRYY